MRSGLARKSSRSGRSTVILRKPKCVGGVDAADDGVALSAVALDGAGRAVVEAGEQAHDVLLAVERDLAALVAEALAQRAPERRGVDELDAAAPPGPLAVGEHPHVGGDAGVVEELLGQGDERLEQVVLEDPAADLALAAARVAGEERRAVHDDGDPRAALGRRPHVREHVQQEQELAVADARQARPEAAGGAAVVLGAHRVHVALPVLAVGRVGDHVVEAAPGVAVVREGAAEDDPLGVAAVLRLHVEVGLADGEGLGVDLLAEQVDVGAGVHGRGAARAVAGLPRGDVLLGEGEHAPRAAARVVDAEHDALRAQPPPVAREQQVDHEVDDVARREVLAGVLVQRLVELADELFEDGAHRGVVDGVGVQVDPGVAEPLDDLEQQPRLVELRDGVVEVELLEHLAHVGAEPGDVVAQVLRDVGGVGEQLLEVVARRVVEREPRRALELPLRVVEPALEPGLRRQHLPLRRGQHAVEPAQHGEGQDDVLVLAAPEGVSDEVGHPPDEADDLAVVHVSSVPGRADGRFIRLRVPGLR